MKILVYGAGCIGSLYAGLLKESGQDVTILALGERLAAIREHGIQLEDAATSRNTDVAVEAVERLDPEDVYDLILVILPKHSVAEVLPILAANRHSPSVMFLGNNAAGPSELVEALGPERVLLGFPGAGAVTHGDRIRYLILSAKEQPTTIGELQDADSARLEAIAKALEAAGFPTSTCANMDAWLKTHVAEIAPTAGALYMAGADIERLGRTRDAWVLMLRAIREGFGVLDAHGIPITPSSHRIFRWLPEPLLIAGMKRKLGGEGGRIKIGHAGQARREMKAIADEFRVLTRESGMATPAIDTLDRYFDPDTEPVPDGSRELPVRWAPIWIALAGIAAVIALLWLVLRH